MDDTSKFEYAQKARTQVAAIAKLIEYMQHDVHVWDQGADYQRCGRLTYFSLLPSFISSARWHEREGHMTASTL